MWVPSLVHFYKKWAFSFRYWNWFGIRQISFSWDIYGLFIFTQSKPDFYFVLYHLKYVSKIPTFTDFSLKYPYHPYDYKISILEMGPSGIFWAAYLPDSRYGKLLLMASVISNQYAIIQNSCRKKLHKNWQNFPIVVTIIYDLKSVIHICKSCIYAKSQL